MVRYASASVPLSPPASPTSTALRRDRRRRRIPRAARPSCSLFCAPLSLWRLPATRCACRNQDNGRTVWYFSAPEKFLGERAFAHNGKLSFRLGHSEYMSNGKDMIKAGFLKCPPVCVCVCVAVACIRTYVCVGTCIYMHMHAYTCTCMHACMCMRACVLCVCV